MSDERKPIVTGQNNTMYNQPQASGYPHPGAPPPQPGYAPPQQGHPPQQGGYPPQQGGYPPQQGGYPPQQGGYPPQQGGNPPQQGGYPPPQQGYQQQGYPAPQPGAPGGYPPSQGGFQGNAEGTDTPAYKGEVPDDDVEADPNAAAQGAPQTPTAPPAEMMDRVEGYNQMDSPLPPPPPPSYDEAMKSPADRAGLAQAPTLSSDEAKEALISFAAENCCYGNKPARELFINRLNHSAAFHYTLETFTEKRTTKWKHEPYVGQPIDGPQNGHAPQPWDIYVKVPSMFQNSQSKLEVPHTASVKPCHDCRSSGYRRCHTCLGRGRTRCHHCHGHGRCNVSHYDHHEKRHINRYENCSHCMGMGRRRCFTCHGHGQIACSTCSGRGSLKCYIQLTVDWTNHSNDSIIERTALPDELIRNVTGQIAFKEEQPRVYAINHFPDQAINQASSQLVQQHAGAFQMERILQQRHQVRIIPVAEAQCRWKEENFSFFVYGFERKVHAPDYPQQCCCGCTII